jgi:oligopeptide/dipeptide ABC transporter ATP-binding protein
LRVEGLKTHFFTRGGVVKAVDGVSFSLREGETLGIVGESGSGKSITCLSILREMRRIRGAQISMILQDPMTSLNPVYTIGNQVAEPIKIHQKLDHRSVDERVKDVLTQVHIPAPAVRMREYPYQMSGGMRQRIVGAMALSCRPQLLIADEPTTALDVTIQAQFIRLFKEIQRDSSLSMIVVTHDLGVVSKICDQVLVMYAGKIVENASIDTVFNDPQHPYTVALIHSLPRLGTRSKRLISIEGQPPDLGDLPPGCSFAPRCPVAMDVCRQRPPSPTEIDPGHAVSCWRAD